MFNKSLLAAAVLAVSSSAYAQSPASLTVTGQIVPDICGLSLSAGGVVNYDFAAATVKQWPSFSTTGGAIYEMPLALGKLVNFEVHCPNAAKFGLSVVDNRITSAVVSSADEFGLGMYRISATEEVKIGMYYMNIENLAAQTSTASTPIQPLSSMLGPVQATSSSTFVTAPLAAQIKGGQTLAYSNLANAVTPGQLTSLTGQLRVLLRPLKSTVDNASSAIPLDGSATITLVGL